MAYGTVKVDNITFTNGGIDQTVTVSGIVQSISGNITATGTIQGQTIIGTSTVSGATVTGNAGQFTTATAATGIFTSQISGATITGNVGSFTTITGGTVTLTSGVFASGTAAAPSVSIGTTDNGLYSPGTDQVAVATNGSGRLFVDANGNVGIGTNSPTVKLETVSASDGGISYMYRSGTTGGGAQINVNNGFSSTVPIYSFWYNGSTGIGNPAANEISAIIAGSEVARIDSSGRLGVGTSSPLASSLLCLGGSFPSSSNATYAFTNNGTIPSSSTTEAAAFLSTYSTQDAAVTYSWLAHYIAAQGTITGGSRLGVTHQAGFQANNSLTGATNNYGFYSNIGTGTGRWNFYAAGTANNYFAGSVGIGTTSPATQLGFPIGTNTTISQHAATTHSASNVGSLVLGISDGGGYSGVYIHNTHDGTYSSQDIRFLTALGGISVATERMRITSGGAVLIGKQALSATTTGVEFEAAGFIRCVRDTGIAAAFQRYNSDGDVVLLRRDNTTVGSISVTTTATAYNTSSDYRLKENITPVSDGIARLQQLKPSRFNFIADPDKTVDGFLAHEVQDIVPEAITGKKDAVDEDGNPEYQGIDQSKLVPLLTAALQEAIGRIEALEAEVAALKAQ